MRRRHSLAHVLAPLLLTACGGGGEKLVAPPPPPPPAAVASVSITPSSLSLLPNVPPVQAFRLIDALIRANKPYDLLYLPNRTHSGNRDPFAVKTAWNYFVEHLLGDPPVADAVVTVTP